MTGRADEFRKQVLEAESKAFLAKTEPTRRAWMIIAREWNKMAEREELKYHAAPQTHLVPEPVSELEAGIRSLAATLKT